MKKVAKWLKSLDGWMGDAQVFKMTPPLEGHKYVVVSAVVAMFSGPETYIFGCSNKEGENVNFGELEGSFKGDLDHVKALEGAGYECVR